MLLGQRIYQLRTARNMSQEELADLLAVSRQSVSKWENNNAVPDLDKLLGLSEVFGITLDELVKGEASPPEPEPAPAPEPPDAPKKPAPPARTVGIVLLCMGGFFLLMTALFKILLLGVMVAIPLAVCGVICMRARRHPGLWCAWVLVVLVDLYLRWATGLSWTTIIHTFRWTPQMNYLRLATAWCQFGAMVGLTAGTVRTFCREGAPRKKRLVIAWTLTAVAALGLYLVGLKQTSLIQSSDGKLNAIYPALRTLELISTVLDWLRTGGFAAAVTETIRAKKHP